MGKGDKRSKRGKIWRGTFGKSRPRKKSNSQSKTKPGSKGTRRP
jgi:30S ribosomal protein S31